MPSPRLVTRIAAGLLLGLGVGFLAALFTVSEEPGTGAGSSRTAEEVA